MISVYFVLLTSFDGSCVFSRLHPAPIQAPKVSFLPPLAIQWVTYIFVHIRPQMVPFGC
ncbi:Uncharacterized protein TCM_035799 [Theobroma cacao]|uniref:Uncharacterized protein n=1 Tax=Theobroma cacao TaxID=3641 RepID=A0A061FJL1_THECC|nr:Uncharacterized protein TCM_035799 [Theobroma cacao]